MAQVSTLDIPSTLARSPPASFSTLPDELLDAIIDRLPSWYIIPALNRRLLPFNRAQRFKVHDFWISEARHYRLNRCLRLNPALGAFVQELRIGVPTDKLNGPPPVKKQGKKGKGKGGGNLEQEKAFKKLGTKEEELNYLLLVLNNLRHLEIYGSVEFIDTFLPGTENFTRIPSLNRLVLDSRRHRHYQPDYLSDDEEVYFDPFDLSALREINGEPLPSFKYFNNREYIVDIHRHSSPLESSSSAAVSSLSFEFRLFLCNDRKEPFLVPLSTLPLSHLQITHFGKGSDLISLLGAVPNPESLRSLSLFALNSQQHFETLLASFTNLTSLSLGRSACINTPSFYNVISNLPLRHLHLGPGSRVASERILEYLSEEPKKISTLSTLTLDNIDAKIAPVRQLYKDHDYHDVRMMDEWVLPEWEEAFTRAGAEEIRIAAAEAGVQVEGTTFYALDIFETEEYKEDKAEQDEVREEMIRDQDRGNRQYLAEQEEKEQQQGWHDEVCSCDRNPERCNKYRDNMGLKPYEGNYRWNRRW